MIDNCRKPFVLVRLDYPLNLNKKIEKVVPSYATQSGWAALRLYYNCYFRINVLGYH